SARVSIARTLTHVQAYPGTGYPPLPRPVRSAAPPRPYPLQLCSFRHRRRLAVFFAAADSGSDPSPRFPSLVSAGAVRLFGGALPVLRFEERHPAAPATAHSRQHTRGGPGGGSFQPAFGPYLRRVPVRDL